MRADALGWYVGLLLVPVGLAHAFSLCALLWAARRLRCGMPATFAARLRVLFHLRVTVAVCSAYTLVTAACVGAELGLLAAAGAVAQAGVAAGGAPYAQPGSVRFVLHAVRRGAAQVRARAGAGAEGPWPSDGDAGGEWASRVRSDGGDGDW